MLITPTNNSNSHNNTVFKSALFKELTRKIPNTKTCKNLTQLDRNVMSRYLCARQFKLGTTKEEFTKLQKYDGFDFVKKTYDFLIEKLQIPKTLTPQLKPFNQSDSTPFAYDFKLNVISFAPSCINLSKNKIFVALRHELQHLIQNFTMLRNDEMNDLLIEHYVDSMIKQEQCEILNIFTSNISTKDLIQNKILTNKEQIKTYQKAEKAFLNNDIVGFEKAFTKYKLRYKDSWNRYKDLIKEELGPLNEKEKEKSYKYFDSFADMSYWNKDGSINIAKYSLSMIEEEANCAGEYALFETNEKGCFYKELKNETLNFINSKDDFDTKLKQDIEDLIYKTKS